MQTIFAQVLAILFTSLVSSEPFSILQVLNQPINVTFFIDVSYDNHILVAANGDNNTYVYLQNSGIFTLFQVIPANSSWVFVSDITGDGQLLLVVEYFAVAQIYKNTNDQFNEFQTLTPPDGSNITYAGAITDDHMWVVLGTQKKAVFVYKFDGQKYELNHSLTTTYPVRNIALTQDHNFLIVGTTRFNVQVYEHNGTHFKRIQLLTYSTDLWKLVSLTDDHSYLTVADEGDDFVYRYKYNPTSEIFVPFEENGTLPFPEELWFSSVSPNKYWFCASTREKTFLYKNIDDTVTQVQILPESQQSHSFSQDGKYLIIGKEGELRIYTYNCDVSRVQFYNVTSGKCEVCQDDLYIDAFGECKYCEIEGDYFMNNGDCLHCNSSESYYIVDDECYYCGVQGCINCVSQTCTKCNEKLDYFMVNQSCLRCSIANCLDCQSYTECFECNQRNNYFLSNGKCQECILEGCLKCRDLQSCEVCDELFNYFLLDNKTCSKCLIEGCISCSGDECLECNENRQYFLHNKTCQKCQLEGCVQCQNSSVCSVCDESRNYFLSDHGICSLCQINNCLKCENLTDCLICHGDYYSENGMCQNCEIKGCLNCVNSSSCSLCDESKDYFLDNQKCSLCQLEGCLNCKTLTVCQICHESRDYFLSSDGQCELCEIQGCLNCKDKDTCLECNTERHYTLSRNRDKCYIFNSSEQQSKSVLIGLILSSIIIIVFLVALFVLNARMHRQNLMAFEEPFTWRKKQKLDTNCITTQEIIKIQSEEKI